MRSATREDVSTFPATTAAGGRALSREPSGATHLDRPVRAGAGRDVGVGEDAHGEVARRARDRERAVEVAVVLGGAAGEVEVSSSPETVAATRSSRSPSRASRTSRASAVPSGSASRHARVRRSA